MYRGSCWYTFDFLVSHKFYNEYRNIEYYGFRVCDPIHNPRVIVYTDAGIAYNNEARDHSIPNLYGDGFRIYHIDPKYIEFWIPYENLKVRFGEGDIPGVIPTSMQNIRITDVITQSRIPITSPFGYEISFTWINNSGSTAYVKAELYRGNEKVCERQEMVINNGSVRFTLSCDVPGRDGEIRLYTLKHYVSTSISGPWYLHTVRKNFVYYHEPGKTVGDIVFRPSLFAYNIEEFLKRNGLTREFRNYGKAGDKLDYVLMLCSMDPNQHQLKDDLNIEVESTQYRCRWRHVDTYKVPLGPVDRQLYLDNIPYKTVRMYGYGGGRIRRVESVSGYTSYRIDADKAVVKSVYGDFAFDYVDGVKTVDVSSAYRHSFFGIRGWAVANSDERFAGFIATGREYVKLFDRSKITVKFDSEYNDVFEVKKDGEKVFSSVINVPAGGEYTWSGFGDLGEYVMYLNWGPLASVKLINGGDGDTMDGGTAAECGAVFRTGVEALDRVLFCVGGYGITVAVLLAVFVVILLLFRRR